LEPEQNYQQEHYFEEDSEDDHHSQQQTVDTEQERREQRRHQMAEEQARQQALEREKDLLEKVKLLEAMIEQIRVNEKDRKGFVDDQKLKRNIENNLETIEEIKQLYPIESQEDERVQETVLQYEKQLIKMLNKIEEEKPQPSGPNAPRKSVVINPSVVKKVEAVDNKAIDEMDRIIEEMLAKTVMNQETSFPQNAGPRKSAVFEQKSIESQYFPRKSGINDTKSTNDQSNPRKSKLLGPKETASPTDQSALPRKSAFLGQTDPHQTPQPSQLPRLSKLLTIIEAAEKFQGDQPRKSRLQPQNENPLIGQEGRKSRFLLPPSSNQSPDSKQLQIPKLSKLLEPESEEEEEEEEEEVYGKAGDFVEDVVLNKCRGAITVIKIIKESILAVGYSSGEVAFYSLTNGFKFLSK